MSNKKKSQDSRQQKSTDNNTEISSNAQTWLKPEVAEVFELRWNGGHTVEAGRLGRIDFRELTLASAEKLYKSGAKFLVKK